MLLREESIHVSNGFIILLTDHGSLLWDIWEANIAKFAAQCQLREKFCETPYQPISGHCDACLLFQAKQQAEISRIMVLGQTGEKGFQDPISVE
jgi:hypothetical protein